MEIVRTEPRKCSGCGAVVVLYSKSLCKRCYREFTLSMDELYESEAA